MITNRHGALVSEDERNWKICGVTGLMLFFSSLSRILLKCRDKAEGTLLMGMKSKAKEGGENVN